MKDIIIWGAGFVGEMACSYYKNKCNILGFVDSDNNRQGTVIQGTMVYEPDVLKTMNCHVVIAVKTGRQDIERKLRERYGINTFTFFSIQEEQVGEEADSGKVLSLNNIAVINFAGGLGNQLFQYAFMLAQEAKGKEVYANTDSYRSAGKMPFILEDIFSKIQLQYMNKSEMTEYVDRILSLNDARSFILYKEPFAVTETNQKSAEIQLLDCSGGIFQGYFQTYKYAERVKNRLLETVCFDTKGDNNLLALKEKMEAGTYISVHVRRGDYLNEHLVRYYGDICTEEYYKNAMEYMLEKYGDCVFCFFSDDMEWVKEHYTVSNAIYIDETMFTNYRDWYDMYLMSVCKHNIIANSTFSWWGAWLNRNPDREVIAPKKWINGCEYKDIYPQEWVLM